LNSEQALLALELSEGCTREQVQSQYRRLAELALKAGETSKVSELMQARKILLSQEPINSLRKTEQASEGALVVKHILSSTRNTFITGPGGTGKSHILRNLQNMLKDKNIAVLAFTGIAAMNVNGETIHKFFKFKPVSGLSCQNHSVISPREATKLKSLDLLVIDEVSMLSADMLDAIDQKLQAARRNDKPFGGVRVLFFGDPYQLPPVPNRKDVQMHKRLMDKYPLGNWFFEADCYSEANFETIGLKTNHRADDSDESGRKFVEALRKVRTGETNQALVDYFNQRVNCEPQFPIFLVLVGSNEAVDRINNANLEKIKNELFAFSGQVRFVDRNSDSVEDWRTVPVEKNLELKVGAQVMFVKNDDQGGHMVSGAPEPRWVNGTQGVVERIDHKAESIWVKVIKINAKGDSTNVFEVKKSTFDVIVHTDHKRVLRNGAQRVDLEPKVVMSYVQFPLRLAYALTIHKSQGQTYPSMKFDPKGTFEDGQLYVALSRATKLEAIGLINPLTLDQIKVNKHVVQFMKEANPLFFIE